MVVTVLLVNMDLTKPAFLWTSTVTAIPNKKVLKTDPLTEKGIPEAAMLDVILPRAKSAREGIELLAKVIEEKGSAEGIQLLLRTRKKLGTWKFFLVTNM